MAIRFCYFLCLLSGFLPAKTVYPPDWSLLDQHPSSGYGARVARPHIAVDFSPNKLAPTVTLSCATPGATIRYTTDGSAVTPASPVFKSSFSPATACRVRAKAYKTKLLASKESTDSVPHYALLVATSFFQMPPAGLNSAYSLIDSNQVETKSTPQVVSTIVLQPACRSGLCAQTWQGYLEIPLTGGYEFWTVSDDGSVLSIDHQTIVDNGGNHAWQEKTGRAYLQKGWHTFQLTYQNTGGPGDLEVFYAPVGGARQNILAAMFAH